MMKASARAAAGAGRQHVKQTEGISGKISRILVLALVLSLLASQASGDKLIGVGRYIENNYSGVFVIDTDTATSGMVLHTPDMNWFGATDGPTPDQIYIVNSPFGATSSDLHVLDTSTWTIGPPMALGAVIKELAYDEFSGQLYGTDYSTLYVIPPAGPALPIGPHGNQPGGDPVDNVWSLDASGSPGAPLVGTVSYDTGDNVYTTDAYTFDTTTGAATYVGPTGVERVTDVCFSNTSPALWGVGNIPARLYEMDPTGAVIIDQPLHHPDANILGLANAPLGLVAPTAIEPVPVILQGDSMLTVNVESSVELYDWDTEETYEDWQDNGDFNEEAAPVSASASAYVDDPTGAAWCSADTTAEAEAWQDGGRVNMKTYLEHASDGEDGGLEVDLAVSHDASADIWGHISIEPTATVLEGQPGRLILEVGDADLGAFGQWSFWDIRITDGEGEIVGEVSSEVDSPGEYQFDVTVGEIYDVFYQMYGSEWAFPPFDGILEQEISFGALGEVSPPAMLGDSNDDGVVDDLDYLNLTAQFGGPPGAQSADFNEDGWVDLHDFAILRDNFGAGVLLAPGQPGATTPEPATLSLLGTGSLVIARRRRRRS